MLCVPYSVPSSASNILPAAAMARTMLMGTRPPEAALLGGDGLIYKLAFHDRMRDCGGGRVLMALALSLRAPSPTKRQAMRAR